MTPRYKLSLRDLNTRTHEIDLRATEARKRGDVRRETKFRDGVELLPVIPLPIDYPVYRLENYRTGDEQLSRMAAGKVPAGFFETNRREDPSVQQVQHDILLQLALRGSGETIKPIYNELERVKRQTEELIVTADGVVVNGNRRLCAMRELYAPQGNSGEFSSFQNVMCMVLPASATPDEILRLEIALQMQPETKLPYEWTALGRAVRDLRAQGTQMTDEVIADLMNRDKVDIQRAARMIDSADLYLREWLSKPNAYDQLEDTEQAFKQIATRNMGSKNEVAMREITRKFDFFLVEQRENLTERAYDLINSIENNPRLFLDTLAAEWNVDLPRTPPAAPARLKIQFDDSPKAEGDVDYSPLTDIVVRARQSESDAKDRTKSLEQVCQIVSEQAKQPGKAALNFARKAQKALKAIDLTSASAESHAEIATTLHGCAELCAKLEEQLDKFG